MILRARNAAILAIPLTLLASSQSFAQEKTGTKQDVEKRLKAAQKPQAATPLDNVVKTLFAAHTFQQAALSPDGNSVAWVEDIHSKNGVVSGSTVIYVKSLKAAAAPPRRISAGVADSLHAEGSVAWSPDSQKVAFLSDAAKKGQLQLYVTNAAGGAAKMLTNVKGFLSTPSWSPNGKTIALLFTENATRASGPLVAETPETGEIKDAFFEQRLALVDLPSGKLSQITPADTYIYEYDWSPDGNRFVVSSAPGNGDNNWWIAELSTLDAATGLMKSIYKPKLQIANPVWSPDGKQIVFIEGLMSDEGVTGGDIHMISSSGGEAKNLTKDMKASAAWLGWLPDKKILFSEFVGGNSAIATLDPANGKIEPRWSAEGAFSSGTFGFSLSATKDGATIAGIFRSFSHAPEVVLITGGSPTPTLVTNRNASLKPAWGEAKSITWKNDGYEVHGWLLYPRDFDPSKKYPLVVNVHGGPSSLSLSHWPGSHDFAAGLSGMGYFVLYPNPRGSYGQGEGFTRANVKDFGYGDFKDILAGVDEALRVAPIDSNRLGITGWSYGGFMTMWAVTQTNRFKAAMAGAGLSNWQSYYGENLIDQWMIPFFGKSVYDDPEIYAKSSPINFIKKVKTPTLIVVGDSDGEVPAPQSYEFWHALKTLGVETQFVVYEGEGHRFANPKHQRDVIARTLAWFDAHLRQ
jgi:dipeptidyl aminopeptidase/acylaminoacyl peptidase